ncbi:MAG: AI-2E family transporter [marine bacterium B5-7]|nr:MAG: AI-2E family transporter [marine bacterium B5-7]
MRKFLNLWAERYLSDPEAIILLLTLFFSGMLLWGLGKMLAPALVALVLAYLLDWAVSGLTRCKLPHTLAVWLVFLSFIGASLVGIIGVLPSLLRQAHSFIQELPVMLTKGQVLLMQLPDRYPDYISPEQVRSVLVDLSSHVTQFGQWFVSHVLTSIPNAIILMVYAVLVPMLIFLFLKDKTPLLRWFRRFSPEHKRALHEVMEEMHVQIGNYVRGKIIETVIISTIACTVFMTMDLRYAMLLGILVGLSVIVPYIGAVAVTVPVVMVSLLQFGWSPTFAYLIIAYAVIMAVDANVLVPVLFSEANDLHPVAIILAVLVFGGLWGFWGVFFAIPLASLVKAIINAWPVQRY